MTVLALSSVRQISMVNAFDAFIRSPMLFRSHSGMKYLNVMHGYPATGVETITAVNGRTHTQLSTEDYAQLMFSWGAQPSESRWGRYDNSTLQTLTEITGVTVTKGTYRFTVNYSEYSPVWGSRDKPNRTRYTCNLPNNARLYVYQNVERIYQETMESIFPGHTPWRNLYDSIGASPEDTVNQPVFRRDTIENLLGEGVELHHFLEAQDRIVAQMRNFLDREVHHPTDLLIGEHEVEAWRSSNTVSGDFFYERVKNVTFNLSLKSPHSAALLLTPVMQSRVTNFHAYTMDNGRLRQSNAGAATSVIMNYALTLPDEFQPGNSRSGARHLYGGESHNTEAHNISNLVLSRGGTKARPKRGAWLGPYTGASKIVCNRTNRTFLEYVSEYGMPGAVAGLKDFNAIVPPVPHTSTYESIQAIEVPKIDMSPVELGHVNLYRLGNSMYDLNGNRLSDFIVPSLPTFIISLNSEKVLTIEEDHQVECVGNDVTCKPVEQVILPPGSYQVEVKEHCNMHHDMSPTREYHRGMGKYVNRGITTRNVLRIIKVSDGQIREDTVEHVSGTDALATAEFDIGFDDRW